MENIVVLESLVQARYSDLLDETSPLTSGTTYQWKIQAKDIFSNVVVGTEELFALQIKDMLADEETLVEAEIEYLFSLYSATFVLTKASGYSCIIRLTQKGGLMATYYETTNFQAPVEDTDRLSHESAFFTQIDSAIDFDLLDNPMVL